MNLVRHELGLSARAKRAFRSRDLPGHLLGVVNTQATLAKCCRRSFPWCAEWEADLQRLFLAYVETKQAQQVLDYDDLLLYWAQMVGEPELGREIGARFSHMLVDEYQDTNRLQAASCWR
jgi:DNA helicase-2/ATP-dependent DNA helicase PcrA